MNEKMKMLAVKVGGAVVAVGVAASPAFATYATDVAALTLDTAPAYAAGLIVLTAIGAIWIIRKVYVIFKKS